MRTRLVGVLLVVLSAVAGGMGQVELLRPEQAMQAIFALDTQLRVELRLLAGLEADYAGALQERDRYQARLLRLDAELDSGWEAPDTSFDSEALERSDAELERLEKALLLSWDAGRRLRQRMLDARARISLLRREIEQLAGSLPADAESLTGYWDVSFVGAEKGVFFLVQSGAVLSGEYGLEGGFRGSLQGTFVDGKVLLNRIDTRLGRVMDLDGTVSADGSAIRGTWRRYDLSSGRPATGAWTASRRRTEAGIEEEP